MPPLGIHFFELEDVIETHDIQLSLHGGGRTGIHNEAILRSAINMPRAGIGGIYFHRDIFEMAAAYLFHIANNHGFNDGNKRTALAVAIDFLGFHDIDIEATSQEVLELSIRVVEGSKTPQETKEMAAEFFRDRAKPSLLDE